MEQRSQRGARVAATEPDGSTGRIARWAIPALLFLVSALRFAPYRFFSPDDYSIYLRFVTNLLERGELAFNPGEPVFAFTSPLWLGILAVAGAMGEPLLAGKICSFLASAASPILVYFLIRRLTGERGLSALGGTVWAFNLWLARWSWSGLETGLSATVPLAALLLASRARSSRQAPWLAGLVAGVAPLVRPEMIGFWLLFVIGWIVIDPARGKRRLWHTAAAVLPGLLISGGVFVALQRACGQFLPSTASAKGTLAPMFHELWPALSRVLQILASTSVIESIVVVAGVGLGWFAWGWRRRWREPPVAWLLLMVAWVAGLCLLYATFGVRVYTRYLLSASPFLVVAAAVVLAHAWRAGGMRKRVILAVAALVVAQNLALDLWIVLPATRTYQRSQENVAIALGKWLGENTSQDAVVAVPDIGAVGYHSRRRILDLNGLITPEIVPYKREGRINEYLERERPDYLIDVHPDPHRMEREGPDLDLVLLKRLRFEKMFIFQDEPLYYSLYRVQTDRSPR